ncbi:MAG: major facilitator superfamily 1 [Phycisphaerales bacterium]|nr:major facilitator superfamily 1 [Phycisphaerales bacterium]
MPTDPDPKPLPAAHPPFELADPMSDQDRPANAAPSQAMLEHEAPTGRLAKDPYAALRLPAFRRFVIAFFLSSAGGQIQAAAVGWEIYDKTKSASALGMLGLVLAVPMLLLSLPAGHLADTVSRKSLFLFMQVSTTLCALGLMIVSWQTGGAGHGVGIMYTLLAIGAIGGTIGRPGREALMAQIVPASLYPNAVTWNSTGFELSSMGGPAIGGLILWQFNPAVAYGVAATCFVVSFLLICSLPATPVLHDEKRPAAGFSDLVAGIRFVFRTKLILAALTLDLIAVLFGGATFVLPVIARDVLHVDKLGFGFLRAAPAIGAVAMALTQARMPAFKRAGPMLLMTVAGFGAATVVLGLSHSYALSFCMLILTGVFDNISVVIRHSIVPLLTPDRMRGRVLAVNQIFVGSSNELGGLESGLTTQWFGPMGSIVGGGLASILVVIAVAAGFPEVRRLKSIEDVRPIEDDDPAALKS